MVDRQRKKTCGYQTGKQERDELGFGDPNSVY